MTNEIGYSEAMRMPREVRHWWLGEMMKERDRANGNDPDTAPDGRKIKRDVPKKKG